MLRVQYLKNFPYFKTEKERIRPISSDTHCFCDTNRNIVIQAPGQGISSSVVFISKKNQARENRRYEVNQDVAQRQCDFERHYPHV